jgi:hypothetical protein
MFCPHCGKEVSTGASSCPACGAALPWAPPSGAATGGPDSLEKILHETKQAAHELAVASARLSKRLVEKAQTAAKDPSGSAKKAAHRVAQELDAAAKEIDEILRQL